MIEQYKDQMRGYLTELLDEKDLPLVDELFDFLIKKTTEESKISTHDTQVKISELLSNVDVKNAFQRHTNSSVRILISKMCSLKN